MGKPAEFLNNGAVFYRVAQLLGITQRFVQAHGAVMVDWRFRMHERQIDKLPRRRLGRLVEAARQRAIGGGTRQRIGREGARSAAKHVARKLIEQKHERERTLGTVLPVRKLAIRYRLMGRQKPRPDGSIEVVVLREPFVVSV